MTSTPTEPQNSDVEMTHEVLGDKTVPWFAVEAHEARDYTVKPEQADNEQTEPINTDPVQMKHPDLDGVVTVPWFAVAGHEERGYQRVDDDTEQTAPAEQTRALPAPEGAATTRATTSGPAKTPSSDGGETATTTD